MSDTEHTTDSKPDRWKHCVSMKIQQFTIFWKRCPPELLVQFCPVFGYVLIFLMVFCQIHVFIPDGWDATSKIYVPPSPVPRGNVGRTQDLGDGISFVTAYFNLGTFNKGDGFTRKVFGTSRYKNWMNSFSMFNNSVILFTDSLEIEAEFRALRKQLPRKFTRVVKVKQDQLWAFQLAPKIKRIYSQPGYPKHNPNTVNERYSCAMHAKYEALETVIRKRMSNTKHLAWIDVGYFREEESQVFKLEVPLDFKEDHVAFTQVDRLYEGLSAEDIIRDNLVWIAGGMFFGQQDILLTFIEDYRLAVEKLMSRNLMNTDQQVLYTMYSKGTAIPARVPLQLYSHKCSQCCIDWFFLGSVCRYVWEKKYWPRPPIGYFGVLAL